jgi:outer membrane protein
MRYMDLMLKVTNKISTLQRTWLIILLMPGILSAQQPKDSSLQDATLENVVRYAMQQNPQLKNALLDEDITETIIKNKLADWYPQINLSYSLQHTFQLPVANINGQFITTGLKNISGAQFGLTQNLFNRDALLAARSARDVRVQSRQNTTNQKINIAVLVSKAFFDVILTIQQLRVIEEDIIRTSKSLNDALQQYNSGVADKTDYKRATISLNNSKVQKKNNDELLKAKLIYLKELMGYPASLTLELKYDTSNLQNAVYLDTLQNINYGNRIEYQQLLTQKNLLQHNLTYNQWSFLPEVSLYGNYNLNYMSNTFSKIYEKGFPNSYAGLLLSVPIFQGGKRMQQIKQARFQLLQVDNDMRNLENSINTEYAQALATYKTHLFNFLSQKENVALAKEVYEIIQLQYRAGVKTYLEVTNAETDLRFAQINLFNSLYQVLSSKIEVQQALGNISY